MSDDIQQAELLQRIDIDPDKPGLFAAYLQVTAAPEQLTNIAEGLKLAIDSYSPGSKVILFDSCFAPIAIPTDEVMEKLGFIRKDPKNISISTPCIMTDPQKVRDLIETINEEIDDRNLKC